MKTSDNFFESATYADGIFKGLLPEFYPPKYKKYINEEVALLKKKIKGSKRILEAGVGIGRLIPDLAPLVKEFVGIDTAEFMINKSREVSRDFSNVTITNGQIEKLSKVYINNYFDFSLCVWNTFGNIKDPINALKELSFVTNGSIFITVFHKGTIRDRLDFYKHVDVEVLSVDRGKEIFYLRGYSSKTFNVEDIKNLADKAKLKVVHNKILGGVILWVELAK